MNSRICLFFALALFAASAARAQEAAHQDMPKNCPMHAAHSGDKARADSAMGFDQAKTTHHFLLTKDGGAIEVTANDPNDSASRDQVRAHLSHIAQMFADGNFDIPMLVHDQVPPGVPDMKRLKDHIHYAFETSPAGARVVIRTDAPAALDAVHQFLRFQIEEHHTGDALNIQ
jgi:hypothetical protein